jgi:hypothetical protein
MTDRELMQQALSVLCNNVYPIDGVRDNRHLTPKSHAAIYQQTIDVLRDRLAKPEQEPVAWELRMGNTDRVLIEITNNLQKAHDWKASLNEVVPLYTTPRPWVGLTDEEVKHMLELFVIPPQHIEMVVQAIEAKLKEKNGGSYT